MRLRRAAESEAQQAREVEVERKRLRDMIASIPGVVWEAWGEPDSAGSASTTSATTSRQ